MAQRMIFLWVIFQNIWTNVNDMLKSFIYMIKLFPKRDMAKYLLKNNGLLLSWVTLTLLYVFCYYALHDKIQECLLAPYLPFFAYDITIHGFSFVIMEF